MAQLSRTGKHPANLSNAAFFRSRTTRAQSVGNHARASCGSRVGCSCSSPVTCTIDIKPGKSWRSFAAVGLIGRKVLFNVIGLFVLVLGESVPLCAADLGSLPSYVSNMIIHGSVAACSSQATPVLHVFMLGIVPYVEASIFVQLLTATVGWRRLPLPQRYQMSQEQAQTSYGRAATMLISTILGTLIAFMLAAVSVKHLIAHGVVGCQEFWNMTSSLVAGSAMIHMLSDMLTRFGLGQGIGFIYMVLIASRMQTQWQGVLAAVSSSYALHCAVVVLCLTIGCVIVSNLKHFIPLVSARIGDNDDELASPRLPVVLCPHSTMVFIAAHWLGTIFSGWSTQAMNAVIAITIIAGSVVDIGPTTASFTSSLRDMQLAIPGVTQGQETRETLVASLVVLRLLGSVALLTLFLSSRLADSFLSLVAGAQISVIEILIIISTITQSFRTVERSLQEARTANNMTAKLSSLLA
eukprot:jgi/Ulvmu1/7358/UM036_0018.1